MDKQRLSELADATNDFSPMEQLVIHIFEAQDGAYRDWIPKWTADLYGDQARSIAAQMSKMFHADHVAHVAKLKEALRKYVGVRDGFGKISANLALGLPCDHDFYCHNPDDQDNGCLHDTEGRMKHPCKHCGKTRAALNREARNG